MKRVLPLTILAVAVFTLLAPTLVTKVFAIGCSNNCYLQALTNVAGSDATIWVKVDGSTLYTLPYTFPFPNGTTHTIQVMNTTFKGSSGTRYVWQQWTHCGTQWTPNPTMTTPLMVVNYTSTSTCPPPPYTGPFIAQFSAYPPVGCNTNCLLQVTASVPSTDGTIWIRLDNSANYPLPYSTSFPNGTTHTIQVLNTTLTASSAHYVWKQWTQGTNQYPSTTVTVLMIANYTTSGVGPFVAQFDKQYQLTMTFTGVAGQAVSPPTSVTLQSGTSTVTLSLYSNVWISATVWTVANATWDGVSGAGASGAVSGTQTIDLTTGSLIKSIQLNAYSATIRVVDNNNNPIQGAKITVTIRNSTSRVFTTDSQGTIQLGQLPAGSYTAQVSYQNQNMGTYVADPSQTPNKTIQLNVGGSTTTSSQTSAIVLLAIFGVALVLILVAIKVRKPPAPPQV